MDYAAYYSRYRCVVEDLPHVGPAMDYDWSGLAGSAQSNWLTYGMMFQEFARELANSINELTKLVRSLTAWKEVIDGIEDEAEKLGVLSEFVLAQGTIALNLPYVIRSRFIFAAAHLSHQANHAKQGKEWVDDFPLDGDIYMGSAEEYSKGWKRFGKLKLSLEKIAGKAFREDTRDFRNTYNHRFSPRIELGGTGFVTRHVEQGPEGQSKVWYSIGYAGPLSLATIVKVLTAECKHCYKAYDRFKDLVREHEHAMVQNALKHAAGGPPPAP